MFYLHLSFQYSETLNGVSISAAFAKKESTLSEILRILKILVKVDPSRAKSRSLEDFAHTQKQFKVK